MLNRHPQSLAGNNLSRLIVGELGIIETARIESWNGPNGHILRQAYVVEQFARFLCNGDLMQAKALTENRYSSLGSQSLAEAANTDAGMLKTLDRIAEMKADRGHRGMGLFFATIEKQVLDECILLLNLFPLAWGLRDHEFELILGVPNCWLASWRNGCAEIDDGLQQRVRRLRSWQRTLQLVVRPEEYAAVWRSVWPKNSVLGSRSLLQAFKEDGDVALDRIETFFWIYHNDNQDDYAAENDD